MLSVKYAFSSFLFFFPPFSHAFVFNVKLQKFINKQTIDLENVQRNKKKEKREFTKHEVSSSKSLHVLSNANM